MNTSFGLACRTCNKETEKWFPSGQGTLKEFAAAHKLLKPIRPLNRVEIAIQPGYHGGNIAARQLDDFLTEHEGHDICIRDEYGRDEELGKKNA